MNLIYILVLLGAAAIAVWRVVAALRRAKHQRHDDWDAQMIKNLRASGANAFTPYQVDFFFSLPDEAACNAMRQLLEPEGYAVDARAMQGGDSPGGFSLHARRHMRLSISDMQECSRRFRELAAQYSGSYDGWATDLSSA